jgi:hypothetical protein
MTTHLLYFRLLGADRFERRLGGEIAAAAREDLAGRFDALARGLLRQHVVLAEARSPSFGTWLVPFELSRLEIDAGEAEQLQSIVSAGRELAKTILLVELGTAAAPHARLEVGTLKCEAAAFDPSAWTASLAALP